MSPPRPVLKRAADTMRYEGRGAVVGCIFCICMCKYGFIVFLVFVVDGVDVAVGGSPLLGGISFSLSRGEVM